MELEEAKKILGEATRQELRDHAFGDREVFWIKDGVEIANGYFGGGHSVVTIDNAAQFSGDEARELAECGTLGQVERNDETGPNEFTEGEIMPGLSTGDVFHELTGQYQDGS